VQWKNRETLSAEPIAKNASIPLTAVRDLLQSLRFHPLCHGMKQRMMQRIHKTKG
jgi:hypothetical protein